MTQKRIVKQLIHSINPSIRVKFRRNSNNCDIAKKIVYLDLKQTRTLEFHHHLKRIAKVYNFRNEIGTTLWVVLHEVGHIMTAHKVKDLDTAVKQQAYKVEQWQTHAIPQKHLSKAYAMLELERLANEWAFNYAKAYYKQLQVLKSALE
jgi:extradiol dioxygenase family protein